jgi:hypothetical protein
MYLSIELRIWVMVVMMEMEEKLLHPSISTSILFRLHSFFSSFLFFSISQKKAKKKTAKERKSSSSSSKHTHTYIYIDRAQKKREKEKREPATS